jgi:hypothetical protein
MEIAPDWQAIATLITGFLAVGAAWKVSDKQTAILRRQSKIAETDLKIQLLEQRSRCVREMRQISTTWQMHGQLNHDEWRRFHALLQDCQLIFPEDVWNRMSEAVSGVLRINELHDRHERYQGRHSDLAAEALDTAFAEEDKIIGMIPQIADDLVRHSKIDLWEDQRLPN